jgi:catechol 2,3-dioxygenase-like lactoylglutathione lyase family enzyme
MKLSFDHVGVVSSDLAKATDFYVRLLGGSVSSMGGHSVVVAGEVRIALVPRHDDDPSSLPWGHHVAVRAPIAEREALLSRLTELGAPYEDVRGRVYTRDPDGTTLEIVFDA